jgi:hypothetical protein
VRSNCPLPFVTAASKLAEAQFLLEKMRSVTLVTDDFSFYLSACVSALYSCIQHLLFDYAKRYWPSLSAENHVDAWHFQLLAKTTAHQDALRFLDWYNKLDGQIKLFDTT